MTTPTTKTPKEIIRSIIDALHMSIRAFAREMNEPYSKIFDIQSGRTKVIVPSVQQSIAEHYGVNMNYLRTGQGEMFCTPQSNHPNQPPQPEQPAQSPTTDNVANAFLNVISALREENAQLERRVTALERKMQRLSDIFSSSLSDEDNNV